MDYVDDQDLINIYQIPRGEFRCIGNTRRDSSEGNHGKQDLNVLLRRGGSLLCGNRKYHWPKWPTQCAEKSRWGMVSV